MDLPTASAGEPRDRGDLGRRVVERRRELGLEREEVARRAGMDVGYLEWMEDHAGARPSMAACDRLAVALGTTVTALQGGGLEQPPGHYRPAQDVPLLAKLDLAECLELIRPGGIGRVVFEGSRGPVALPVNFRMLDEDIVFHTGEGTISAAVTAGRRVGWEVDRLDEALGEGWSVLVSGPASLVVDHEELRRVDELDIEPWAGGDRRHVVRIVAEEVSGRRIRHPGAFGA